MYIEFVFLLWVENDYKIFKQIKFIFLIYSQCNTSYDYKKRQNYNTSKKYIKK